MEGFITLLLLIAVVFVSYKMILSEVKKYKAKSELKKYQEEDEHKRYNEKVEVLEVTLDLEFNKSQNRPGKYLIFDIETGGLYHRDDILQLSWIILDQYGHEVEFNNYYIKNTKNIPIESTKIHGITDEFLSINGVDWDLAAQAFLKAVENCKYLVAHNIEFDFTFVKSRLMEMPDRTLICTMKKGTNFCAIDNGYNSKYKYPKLEELVSHLFYEGKAIRINNQHDSKIDVLITAKCFLKMRELRIITS